MPTVNEYKNKFLLNTIPKSLTTFGRLSVYLYLYLPVPRTIIVVNWPSTVFDIHRHEPRKLCDNINCTNIILHLYYIHFFIFFLFVSTANDNWVVHWISLPQRDSPMTSKMCTLGNILIICILRYLGRYHIYL